MFSASQTFNFADTWPVGSFRYRGEAEASAQAIGKTLMDPVFEHFDVPCWPELTGFGTQEELIGFWLPLFQEWELAPAPELIEKALMQRPGFAGVYGLLKTQPAHLLKGQMLGPATLQWALKQQKALVIDREKIIAFTKEAFTVQSFLLGKIAKNTIVSLDEPCAFLDASSARVWTDLFDSFGFESQFGIALHNCGELRADIFQFPWNVIHVDFQELQNALLRSSEFGLSMRKYFADGGWLALGALSSSPLADDERSMADIAQEIVEFCENYEKEKILLSTSCGIGETELARTLKKMEDLTRLSRKVVDKK